MKLFRLATIPPEATNVAAKAMTNEQNGCITDRT
jgi:hypothetical protein